MFEIIMVSIIGHIYLSNSIWRTSAISHSPPVNHPNRKCCNSVQVRSVIGEGFLQLGSWAGGAFGFLDAPCFRGNFQ